VGGSDEPVDIVDYPGSSIRWVVFHKVRRPRYSREMEEFLVTWCTIFS